MSHNTFGHLFRVTTWGESHGPAIGCIVDGCPPGLAMSAEVIQPWLNKRRPGQSRYTSQRKELDHVEILSGVFEGSTTGTPIALVVQNSDQRSKDYGNLASTYRPGHADITYDMKYGFRDFRGGGRSSARETAARVAAGAIARTVLGDSIRIQGALIQIGDLRVSHTEQDWDAAGSNSLFCPDKALVPRWEELLDATRRAGSSIGAIGEVRVTGAPGGWGAPLYGKLDGDIAAAIISINAVKGVEFGDGFKVAQLTGFENADAIYLENGEVRFRSNHAGGILGGISTGSDIIVRFAVKPTSSILIPTSSIKKTGDPTNVSTTGRHDPCVGIRAIPVAEAMIACVLADHKLRHRAQSGHGESLLSFQNLFEQETNNEQYRAEGT